MNTPKAAPAQHPNVELFKTANAQASFIAEALLGFKAENGETYNKLVLAIVKRDHDNKALQTVRYFVDIPSAKVICHDLWEGTLTEEKSEYKRLSGKERALSIKPLDAGGYRFSVMNVEGETKDRLYFDLDRFKCRCLARTVLDYLHCWELAAATERSRHAHPSLDAPLCGDSHASQSLW